MSETFSRQAQHTLQRNRGGRSFKRGILC